MTRVSVAHGASVLFGVLAIAALVVGCNIDFCTVGPAVLIACNALERCPDGSYQNPGG